MNPSSRRTSPIEPENELPADELLSFDDLDSPSPMAAFLAGACAFICFLPYPAIPVGNNSSIQMGNLVTGLVLLFTSVRLWGGITPMAALLVMMPLLSTLKVLLIDGGDASICFKSAAGSAVSVLTLVVAQLYVPRYALAILTGIATVTLLHVAVGALQLYSFASNVFPLAELYVNPSFLSVQDNADTIARWIQRPFGLFPEPSAMSSSLAPFVLFSTAVLTGVLRMRTPPKTWQKVLFAVAAASGLCLIIISKSGHTMPTMAGLLLLLIAWLTRARATFKTYALVASLALVVLPLVVLFAIDSLSERVVGGAAKMGNDSWDERSKSLLIGFDLWTKHGLSTIFMGMGPGRTNIAIEETTGISAVFSILFTYIYDTGALGFLAVGWIGRLLFVVWRQSRWNIAFAAIALVWIIGVTLTTTYSQLLPIWIALAFLTSWNSVCEAPAEKEGRTRPLTSVDQRERPATRPVAWVSPWAAQEAQPGSELASD
jgi:hypothetical protein